MSTSYALLFQNFHRYLVRSTMRKGASKCCFDIESYLWLQNNVCLNFDGTYNVTKDVNTVNRISRSIALCGNGLMEHTITGALLYYTF